MANILKTQLDQVMRVKNIVVRNWGCVKIQTGTYEDGKPCYTEKWMEIDPQNLIQPEKKTGENRMGQVVLDWTGANSGATYLVDYEGAQQAGMELNPAYCSVDNRAGNKNVIVQVGKGPFITRVVAAGQYRAFPIPATDDMVISFTSAGNRKVLAYLSNFPFETEQDDSQDIGDVFTATVVATANGSTILYTPSVATKRVRILSYSIALLANSAGAATPLIARILDGATDIGANEQFAVPVAAAATVGLFSAGQIDCENGLFSGADGNVINANLSEVLTAGGVRFTIVAVEF